MVREPDSGAPQALLRDRGQVLPLADRGPGPGEEMETVLEQVQARGGVLLADRPLEETVLLLEVLQEGPALAAEILQEGPVLPVKLLPVEALQEERVCPVEVQQEERVLPAEVLPEGRPLLAERRLGQGRLLPLEDPQEGSTRVQLGGLGPVLALSVNIPFKSEIDLLDIMTTQCP